MRRSRIRARWKTGRRADEGVVSQVATAIVHAAMVVFAEPLDGGRIALLKGAEKILGLFFEAGEVRGVRKLLLHVASMRMSADDPQSGCMKAECR